MTIARKLPSDFQWCISTLGCSEMDLDAVAELARKFGVGNLELRALEDELDLPAYFERKFGNPQQLSEKLRASNVRISVLDTSLTLIGNTEERQSEFLNFVAWAEAAAVPFLRVFDGGKASSPSNLEQIREGAETIRWWQSLRQQNSWNVDIAMETHDAICSAQACLALEEQLEQPCPILWDAHHTFHKAGEPIGETWSQIHPFVRHIHFKDSTPEANDINDYTLAVPGTGRFPLNELLALLRKDHYKGAICLEWERKWQPWAAPLSEALEALSQTVNNPT